MIYHEEIEKLSIELCIKVLTKKKPSNEDFPLLDFLNSNSNN